MSLPPVASRTQSGVPGHSTFELHQVSSRQNVMQLASFLREVAEKGGTEAVIDAREAAGVYPNAAAPISAIIQHYRDKGISVRILETPDSFFAHTRIRNPLTASPANLASPESQLNVVWLYDRESSAHLADSVVAELSRKLEFGAGVLAALNWCLYEVLDNVFEHAGCTVGYFMAQIHRNSKQLSLCIADNGIGVHRSFYLGGAYRPRTAFDALTLAVREGVSSTGDRRGNGLFGLKGVVEHNGGRLTLLSGRAYLQISPSGFEGRNVTGGIRLDSSTDCTSVDFQLDVARPVSIADVLGYRHVDSRLEAIESDEGLHVVAIREHAYGTGSREAARELRNHLLNYISSGASSLVLDFSDVPIVSSSFADETIGMLAARYGPVGFGQRFRLVNMGADVQALLDRAIAIRISEGFKRDDGRSSVSGT